MENQTTAKEGDNGTVTITRDEYDRLRRDYAWLQCLEAAGVDNWQGIEFAQEMWREDKHNPEREKQ